jgi:hypothetical protein
MKALVPFDFSHEPRTQGQLDSTIEKSETISGKRRPELVAEQSLESLSVVGSRELNAVQHQPVCITPEAIMGLVSPAAAR